MSKQASNHNEGDATESQRFLPERVQIAGKKKKKIQHLDLEKTLSRVVIYYLLTPIFNHPRKNMEERHERSRWWPVIFEFSFTVPYRKDHTFTLCISDQCILRIKLGLS